MTDSYKVGYSVEAMDDLREIYSYIANELFVPENAVVQPECIRKKFVHWISCRLVMHSLSGNHGVL
ncbi:hypothetical protein [Lachnoanaerobaculum saburreum]|uniref:hypothetical protein n=1 Tax=Lachnoanaerobaculum saburreum TaxID=467210 RepID=UPI001FA77989|nr:hypothetical protein [Lachnoanaerobaculum saburreum]